MRIVISIFCVALVCHSGALMGAGGDRDQKVIADRDQLIESDTWIYNDLTRAKEIAADAGKPMMIVFRCIP